MSPSPIPAGAEPAEAAAEPPPQATSEAVSTRPVAELLAQLEELSRARPDRVLRLTGTCPADGEGAQALQASQPVRKPSADDERLHVEPAPLAPVPQEPFELLIFRGFSSSTTHPTAFDPDRPALPEGSRIAAAELLQGPLDPAAEQRLAGPVAAETFLDPSAW